jgi:hypothetical protein
MLFVRVQGRRFGRERFSAHLDVHLFHPERPGSRSACAGAHSNPTRHLRLVVPDPPCPIGKRHKSDFKHSLYITHHPAANECSLSNSRAHSRSPTIPMSRPQFCFIRDHEITRRSSGAASNRAYVFHWFAIVAAQNKIFRRRERIARLR